MVRGEAGKYFNDMAGRLEGEGIDVDVKVLEGRTLTIIAYVAREVDHSMIAMAARSRSGISRLVIGSVAKGVVRTVATSVLMVRSQTTDTSGFS